MREDLDELAEATTVESGVGRWAGVVDSTRDNTGDGTAYAPATELAGGLETSWREVGLPVEDLDRVVVTPAGAAGLDGARGVQRTAVRVAAELSERAQD